MLRRALGSLISEVEGRALYSAFDQIGGIIVIRIPPELYPKRKTIGRVLLGEVKAARSVYCQSSDVEGEYRTRSLELLAGVDDTSTEYKEHGCRFMVDVEKAFFTPRLSAERERIAGLVRDDEVIINMFAGIGTFSIVAAKKRRVVVFSVDSNPEASRLCGVNARRNSMEGTVISVHGDAAEVSNGLLRDTGDRTLMLLPERSDEFLRYAVDATKSGGTIHYYSHVHADRKREAGDLSSEHFLNVIRDECSASVLNSRVVRAVGPRYYQTVVDAKIDK